MNDNTATSERGPLAQPAAQLPDCCRREANRDEAEGHATCIFGCGSRVDDDHGMCLSCREHSANEFECPECGKHWQSWTGDPWIPA